MNNYQPPSASGSPRFCNMGRFMRLPEAKNAEGLDFAILGIPFDTAASFRPGARFGPNGIRNISAMIKPNNVTMGVNIMEELKGADLGDVDVIPDYIHETYSAIEEKLTEVLNAGAVPISLGGDHAVTLGELRAIYKKYGKVALVHFDSHLDLCDTVFGQKYNHGTPFRRALEERLIDPSCSIQMGMRGSLYDPDDFKIAADLGFKVIPGDELHKITPEELGEIIKERVGDMKVFLTFDIDFADPAYAPGTGTPEVGGFTSFEVLQYIRNIKDLSFAGFDIVEVAPPYDHSEITAYLAANIAFEFMSILAYQKKKNK
ncbi:MAG: agmatinase [Clostridiales bacterium]|nr:agmatinase [Clostridiales bacterium]